MKRVGDLIPRIVAFDNLLLAWRRAIRGKRERYDVLNFSEDLKGNLTKIGAELAVGRYRWGNYSQFVIFDPKERVISVPPFRDRVAQHAIIALCSRVFENAQIDQSFSCRLGKGQTRAVDLALSYSRRFRYYLKMDVRRYFASIDHSALKSRLASRFKDDLLIRAFFSAVDSFETEPNKGIPIGSLFSQYFANDYLTPLDRFIKERLKSKGYARYMDDFVLWSDDKNELKRRRNEIIQFARDRLLLTFKESAINSSSQGLAFLGTRVFPDGVRLSSRARLRFRRKYVEIMGELSDGKLSESKAAERLQALFAFASRFESKAFRLRVMEDEEKNRRVFSRIARGELEQQPGELSLRLPQRRRSDEAERE